MKIKNQIEIIDCTLRDGGYYNNWQFSKRFIQKYFDLIIKTPIRFVEIGFLFFPTDRKKGLTANCDFNFFKTLNFKDQINLGIMINGSDLIRYISKQDEIEKVEKLKNLEKTKISFVRIACHSHEIFKISKYLNILKKNKKLKLYINIMQISEFEKKNIKKVCLYANKYFNCMYLADSLGSIKKHNLGNIIKHFKEFWANDLGIHAHDNLSLALENSIYANNNGVKWLDSTVCGMGRGPGNTKTEELLRHYYKLNITQSNAVKKLTYIFSKLKKKYNWGTNYFYKLSGTHKIHPTYIQTMLSDKRYNKKDYLKAINFLKKDTAKNFNPFALLSAFKIYEFKKKTLDKSQNIDFDIKKFDKAIILGPGNTIKKIQNTLSEKIKTTTFLVLCLNNSKPIRNNLIHIRVFCHPMRIFSNLNYFKKSKEKLLVPYSCFSKNIQSFFDKRNLIDYGIEIKKKLAIKKNHLTINTPLSLIYSISFLISRNINQIYLAGFDGFSKDEPNQDSTKEILDAFKNMKKFRKVKLATLTPTKFDLRKININKLI